MEVLEEADVAAIGDPGLRAVKKSDENNSPIDKDLCFTFQTFVVPYSFVLSTEGAVGLFKAIVYFLVDLGIRRDGATKIGKLLSEFQFSFANADVRWSIFFIGSWLVKNLRVLEADFWDKQPRGICKAGCDALKGSLCMGDKVSVILEEKVLDQPHLRLGVGLEAS